MEAKAVTKFIHYSPYKARQVIDLIRGKTVEQALSIMGFSPKKGAGIISKTLKSAIANAQFNHSMNLEALYVAKAFVDHGPVWRRHMPRAMGRATVITKPTSHITIILKESEEILKQIEAAQVAKQEAKKKSGKRTKEVKTPKEEVQKVEEPKEKK